MPSPNGCLITGIRRQQCGLMCGRFGDLNNQETQARRPTLAWLRWAGEDEEDLTGAGKFKKPRLGGAGKFHRLAAPEKAHGAGVKGLVRQNEPGKLPRRQAIFDQRQI